MYVRTSTYVRRCMHKKLKCILVAFWSRAGERVSESRTKHMERDFNALGSKSLNIWKVFCILWVDFHCFRIYYHDIVIIHGTVLHMPMLLAYPYFRPNTVASKL